MFQHGDQDRTARCEESMEEYHNQVITSNEIRSTNESLMIQIQALNQAIKELNEEKNERSITIEELREDLLQSTMERDEAEKRKETREAENANKEQKLQVALNYTQEVNNEKKILEETIENLNKTVTSLEAGLKDSKDINKKQEEINQMQEDDITKLSQENELLEMQLTDARNEVLDLEQSLRENLN